MQKFVLALVAILVTGTALAVTVVTPAPALTVEGFGPVKPFRGVEPPPDLVTRAATRVCPGAIGRWRHRHRPAG